MLNIAILLCYFLHQEKPPVHHTQETIFIALHHRLFFISTVISVPSSKIKQILSSYKIQ